MDLAIPEDGHQNNISISSQCRIRAVATWGVYYQFNAEGTGDQRKAPRIVSSMRLE